MERYTVFPSLWPRQVSEFTTIKPPENYGTHHYKEGNNIEGKIDKRAFTEKMQNVSDY
jgi:hypothetical protein